MGDYHDFTSMNFLDDDPDFQTKQKYDFLRMKTKQLSRVGGEDVCSELHMVSYEHAVKLINLHLKDILLVHLNDSFQCIVNVISNYVSLMLSYYEQVILCCCLS